MERWLVHSSPSADSQPEWKRARRFGNGAFRGFPRRFRRQSLQASGICVPVVGDLRGYPFGLGLRPAGSRAQRKRAPAVVATHGAWARRRGRHRLVGDPCPAGVGRVGSRRCVRRSAHRVQAMPQALAGGSTDRSLRREARSRTTRGSSGDCVHQLRDQREFHRAAELQRNASHHGGAGGG